MTTPVAPAIARDTILFTHGGSTRGQVIDYTGRELKVELAGGVQRSYPAGQVLRVETTVSTEQANADAAYARGDLSSAAALYSEARRIENRAWVRRQITAQIVSCYQAIGQSDRACSEFLLLVQSDPETPYFSCIPLAWMPALPSPVLEQQSRQWIEQQENAVAALLGASYLMSTGSRTAAVARLKQLATAADRRVALLALAQTWRAEVVTADSERLDVWRNTIEQMPEPLRSGPYYVLGLGRRQQQQWEKSALAFLRVPLVHAEHRDLASQALLDAGGSLEKLDRTEQAARLYRELVSEYPKMPPVSEARSRLEALAASQSSTGR